MSQPLEVKCVVVGDGAVGLFSLFFASWVVAPSLEETTDIFSSPFSFFFFFFFFFR